MTEIDDNALRTNTKTLEVLLDNLKRQVISLGRHVTVDVTSPTRFPIADILDTVGDLERTVAALRARPTLDRKKLVAIPSEPNTLWLDSVGQGWLVDADGIMRQITISHERGGFYPVNSSDMDDDAENWGPFFRLDTRH